MSGDLAKIFRHEEPKAPGILAVGDPPASATLLAREVIQNSWDAGIELSRELGADAPDFAMEFRFLELTGSDRQAIVEAMDLAGLASRASRIDRAKVGLAGSDALDSIGDEGTPLRVLRVIEHGASGMHGPWDQNKSHMFMALMSIGFTEKASGAGGSYGYGKAGLINGSRIRSVLAYSCFRERADDPGVSRRLLGVTYWGPHDLEGVNHPGIGTLSSGAAGRIQPFENEEADKLAAGAGLPVRDPTVSEQLGTTFLLVDPSVEPADLIRAVERSWWPAIHMNDFTVTVVDYDGVTLHPRPMQDPVLHSFIESWEVALGRSKPDKDGWYAQLNGPQTPQVGGKPRYPNVGSIGLVADLSGWSYADTVADDDDAVAHRSLVALTRGPRMVVEYFQVGSSTPFIRGSFVADESIDELLRQTEPKAHDSWRAKADDGEVSGEALAMADHVLKRIKQTVNNHRTRLKPPVPPPEDIDLPFFSAIVRKLMSGGGKGPHPPPPDNRPVSIALQQAPQATEAGKIEVVGSASFGLTDHAETSQALVRISISYRFLEDDRVGETAVLHVTAPTGFELEDVGVWVGRLERGTDAAFSFRSESYDPLWTGRLIADGVVIEVLHDADGDDR